MCGALSADGCHVSNGDGAAKKLDEDLEV